MMLVARPLRAVLSFTTNQRHNQHFVTTASAAATRSPPPATLPRAARSTYAPVHGLWIDGVLPSSGGAAVPTTTCSRRPFSSWSSVVRLQYAPISPASALVRTMSNHSGQQRSICVQEITANLHLITERPRNVKHDPKTLRLQQPLDSVRPLVIMPAWLLAKRKPLNKYADIYLPLGFDVLTVTISPWQLFWPAKGSQLVGRDLVNFLHHNGGFAPLLVHGFSVGAYVWGECLVHIASDPQRYAHIVERIVGQVWDSAADITEIPVGVPRAVFPNNPRLNRALGNYMRYHLRTFYDIATQHYERSSHMFHNNMVRTPALMFVSEDDPVGSVSSNDAVRRDWLRLGIECEWKCWPKSEHVSHYMRHQREYLDVLYAHLERLRLLPECAGRTDEAAADAAAELPKLRAKL